MGDFITMKRRYETSRLLSSSWHLLTATHMVVGVRLQTHVMSAYRHTNMVGFPGWPELLHDNHEWDFLNHMLMVVWQEISSMDADRYWMFHCCIPWWLCNVVIWPPFQYLKTVFPLIGLPIIKIRQLWDHHGFSVAFHGDCLNLLLGPISRQSFQL